MDDTSQGTAAPVIAPQPGDEAIVKDGEIVSTHVLVEKEQVKMLKELSRRTRVAQSEYLREAVDDLLAKYGQR